MADKEKKVKKSISEKNEVEFEDWREKGNKVKLVIASIFTLVVISLIGYFVYFYVFLSTERFIDAAVVKFESTMDIVFENINTQNTVIDEYDYELKGKLSIGDYNTNIDFINSSQKLLTSLNIDLKQNTKDLINGNIFYQDNYLYIDSKDLYKEKLAIKMENDLFEAENDDADLNYQLLTNLDDLKYYLVKIVEYNFEALKEGKLTTSFKGINEKEYSIKLSATEKLDANKKLNDLVNDDRKLKDIIDKYHIEDYNYLTVGEFSFTVNTINNELKSFAISTSDFDIAGKISEDKFIIESDNSKLEILMTDERIEIEGYEDDILLGKLTIEYKNNYNISFSSESFEFDVLVKNATTEAKIKINTESITGDISFVISKENEKRQNITAKGNVEIEGTNFNIDLNMDYVFDNNLIEKIDTSAIKKVEDLTVEEQSELFDNMYNLFNKFGLYSDENLEM